MKTGLKVMMIVAMAARVHATSVEIATTKGTDGVSGQVQYGTPGTSGFGGTQWHVKNSGMPSTTTRKGYIRFDTSGIGFAPTHAALELTVSLIDAGIGDNDQTLHIYGMTNQALDAWSTSGVTWENAPANDTGSAFAADLTQAELLGTFVLDYNGDKAAPVGTVIRFSSQALTDFIHADTNGLARVILGRTGSLSSRNLLFAGDTHASLAPPTLTANDDPVPISVLNTASMIVPDTGAPGPANLEANPATLSFDAGARADKLIVSISSETGGGGPPVVTYNGVTLTPVAGTARNHHKGIFYLDDPYTGGAASLTVDMTAYGTVNGVGVGVVSIAGSAPGVAVTTNAAVSSVTITPTVDGSFVMAGFGAQDAAEGAALPPLEAVYGGNVGSAEGATGYENGVPASPQTYAFSGGTTPMGLGVAAFAPDITPPTLAPADIVDDQGGGPVQEFRPVTYSLTFSEAMDADSITADDFTNSAVTSPSPITVGAVTRVNPTSFTVVVTPTDAGNLRLQVGSNVTDLTGNPLAAVVDDDNTLSVTNDLVAPTVSGIVDDKGGADAEVFKPVIFSVAFSETLSASTVDAGDFVNASNAPITVGSVTPGVDTNTFTVHVTPTGTGQLRLRVRAGSVADLAGNPLAADADDDTVITVNADTNAPTLASSNIVDDVDGGPIRTNTLVTYTVTFSEDMSSNTVSAADFGNAGDAGVVIGAVVEAEPNSGVFAVPVTPTSAGTLRLQVNPLADLRDVASNQLDTGSAIVDDTMIVVDDTAPVLTSSNIVDNKSGGPIGKGTAVTYTLTFSEAMAAGTFDSGDFSNVGTAPVHVGAIGQADTNVFTVQVTPTAGGTLQLRVGSSVTDLAGNSLAAAVADGDVITVEDILVYRWTGAVSGDWNDPANWGPNGVPVDNNPASAQLTFPVSSTRRIEFNAAGAAAPVPTANVPGLGGSWTSSEYDTPRMDLLVGNLSVSMASTFGWIWNNGGSGNFCTVGDGDTENGMATLTINNLIGLNRQGGTHTMTVNADGTLVLTRSGSFDFSYDDDASDGTRHGQFLVYGGEVSIPNANVVGMTIDPDNHVAFLASGGSFTARFGGEFAGLSAVEAEIGPTKSFRAAEDAEGELTAVDNMDGTFTVKLAIPPAVGLVIIVR